MLNPEVVTVLAGGMVWSGFEDVSIAYSMTEAARSFRLKIAAEIGGPATFRVFKCGAPVQIFANGSLVVDGYVDRYQPRIGEHTTAEVDVSGRSKAQDVIDSSALHDKGEWKKKDPLEIAKDLDRHGVGFRSDVKLEKVDVHRLVPGETIFRTLEHLCRQQGVTMCGQADGSVVFTNATAAKRHAGALIEGVNIKIGEADHNWSDRHQEVVVRGQRPTGHDAAALEIEQKARDAGVDRKRIMVVVVDDDTDDKRAKKRAEQRRDRAAGEALRAQITVQGWRDDAGLLWEPNRLIYVASPFLAIAQDMLLEGVTLTQSRGQGSLAVLALVDPKAHGGSGSKGGKSGSEWTQGG